MISSGEIKEKESTIKPDVITLGAGPVGLWTTIQLKLRNPEKSFVIFEKSTTDFWQALQNLPFSSCNILSQFS